MSCSMKSNKSSWWGVMAISLCCFIISYLNIFASTDVVVGNKSVTTFGIKGDNNDSSLPSTTGTMDNNDDRKSSKRVMNTKFAICAWVKNEAPYLSEWIEHHAAIGFDSLIVYNDHSTDDTKCVIDAYADKGLLKRIPEDMDREFIDDSVTLDHQGKCIRLEMLLDLCNERSPSSSSSLNVSSLHSTTPFIYIPMQGVVFDLCRKYLHKLEHQSGGSEQWWMYTTDPDEFLWIKRSPGSSDTVKDVMQRVQSNRPDTLTIRIPTLTYGSSGKEHYTPENVMKSFHYRFDAEEYRKKSNRYEEKNRNKDLLIKPYQVLPKAMTLVSAMNHGCGDEREYCFTPHCHAIANETDCRNKEDKRLFSKRDLVQEYLAIAHYKVKSREEFYNRVCLSRYVDKYYLPPTKGKSGYPGCCSPKSYFDSLNNFTRIYDNRMDTFEVGLASGITDTAAHCKTGLPESPCPKHLMEITGEEGIVAMQQWKDSLMLWDDTSSLYLANVPKRNEIVSNKEHQHPLIFSAGFGTTATHSMFKATCHTGLCSMHWGLECCNKTIYSYPDWYTEFGAQQAVPHAAWLAQEKVARAFRVIKTCLFDDEYECPSVTRTFDTLRHHIDNVISTDVDVIHDAPYPEFAEHVLKSAEKLRGFKPIVLLSERNPETWAESRINNRDPYICNPDLTREDGSTPIGSNMYLCLKTAIAKGLGSSSIREILIHPSRNRRDDFTKEDIVKHLSQGLRSYQEEMRDIAVFNIDLFEKDHYIESDELGKQIQQALQQQQSLSEYMTVPHNEKDTYFRHSHVSLSPKRACMPDAETAMVTGRYCDKLIVFLHFHKSGGTSMIDHLHKRELRSDFRVNSDPARFDEFEDGDDMFLAAWKNNLRLHSHKNGSNVPTRASSTEFWWSLYNRGLDFVNLEYNFLLPEDYFHVKSVFWTITMIRKPWDRFRSTFEKELSMRCKTMTEACYEKNNMNDWLDNHRGILSEQRIGRWGGILHSNYYVRMLNGLGDQPDLMLNKSHLDMAKRVLDTFDNVLILEEPDASKQEQLMTFFGDENPNPNPKRMHNKITEFQQKSNNVFKKDPMYQTIRNKLDQYQATFEEQNMLDMKLYEYARTKKGSNLG